MTEVVFIPYQIGGQFDFLVDESIKAQFDEDCSANEAQTFDFSLVKFSKSEVTQAPSSVARIDTHWGIVVKAPSGVSYLHHVTGEKHCVPNSLTDRVRYCVQQYVASASHVVETLGHATMFMSSFMLNWAKHASEMTGLSFIFGETCQAWCRNCLRDYGVTISTGNEVAGKIALGVITVVALFGLAYLVCAVSNSNKKPKGK